MSVHNSLVFDNVKDKIKTKLDRYTYISGDHLLQTSKCYNFEISIILVT
jgi:hypothetical protein